MSTGACTRRAAKRYAVPLAIAIALGVHLIVLAVLAGTDLSILGTPLWTVPRAQAAEAPPPDLASSCEFDVLLASSARATMCLAPWGRDVDECLADVPNNYYIDLSGCLGRDAKDTPLTEVAMLEKRSMDKLKPIDPEPLLEALKEPPKPPPELPKPAPAAPAPPPPPPVQARQQMQVVETAKPNTEQAPDNARLLAEYDTKVEKQTVARGTPKEPMVAKSKPAELTPKDHPKDEVSVKEHTDRPPGHANAPDVPGTLSMRSPGAQQRAELEQQAKSRGSLGGATGPLAFDGYVPRRGEGAIEQMQHERTEVPSGQGGAGGGAPDVPNLKPSQEQLERALGGGNVDHLEEVDNGDETALNAKRWVFASFFNRLKRSVAQNWDPASVWRKVDPTGNINGFKTRVTEVRVVLTPNGELSKIVITTPSGVTELDDEAVRAFHAAQPFPNPPKELVGGDGSITFAFSFFFEIGGARTSWRVVHGM
ncbi:MAG TPA: TonB family protein [Kofleriaceae bacterium]|nr:TonB family protein [Kofleriaceae bacterium]